MFDERRLQHHIEWPLLTAVLVVAWDMPFVPAELLGCLRALGGQGDAAGPESGSRRGLEPLCAWYSTACLGPIERRLKDGERRVVSFFDDIRVARLSADDVRQFGDPELMFMNVNTPDELLKAENHAAAAHGRRA